MLVELFGMCSSSVCYNERQHGCYCFQLVVARNTQACPYQTYQTGIATGARKGKGKAKGKCLVVSSEDLEAVRGNIAGHCKIRGIRKIHQVITKPNKPNGARAYFSSSLHVIIAHNHLSFFKVFSSFVHFRPNFQIFFPFSQKSQFMPLLSRTGPGCIYQRSINLMVHFSESIDFYVMSASNVELSTVRLQSNINIFDIALMF